MIFTRPLLVLLLAAPAAALDWSSDPVAQVRTQLETPPPAAERLECRPEVIEAFKTVWKMAGSGQKDYEAAFRVDPGYEIAYMPMTREPYKLPVTYDARRTLAIAHTHPDTAEPTPGPGDYASKVPNFVLSQDALYVTIPGTKSYRFVRWDWTRPCKA